jgi:type III restriction enzyme
MSLEAQKVIAEILPEISKTVTSLSELKEEEKKVIVIQKVKERLESTPQQNFLNSEILEEIVNCYDAVIQEYQQNIIEIPRIMLQQSNEVRAYFDDFELNTRNLNYQPVSEEILRKTLRQTEEGDDVIIGKGRGIRDKPDHLIVNELINYPEINYNNQSDTLFKLANQAIEKFRSYLSSEDVINVVQYHKNEIARFIYTQMKEHFHVEAPTYETPKVYSFTEIKGHHYEKLTKDILHHYKDTIEPAGLIPGKVFTGFSKSCHNLYKFESKTEKDFAIILESFQQFKCSEMAETCKRSVPYILGQKLKAISS